MENTNVLFDRKRLVRLIVPLIVEQVLAVTVGMADMVMVSGAGETAVSGISLVNTICVLLIVIFTSMASGGSVVGAQFLGSGDKKTACHAAEQLVMICGLIAQQEARRMKEENYEVVVFQGDPGTIDLTYEEIEAEWNKMLQTVPQIGKFRIIHQGKKRYIFEDYSSQIGNADAALGIWVHKGVINEKLFEAHPNLKYIATLGHGFEDFDVEMTRRRGVTITNTIYGDVTIAQYAMALLMNICHNVTVQSDYTKTGYWKEKETNPQASYNQLFVPQIELYQKTMGIIGLGAIGQLVANAATHLGMEVYGYDPYISVDAAWNLSRDIHHIQNVEDIYRTCDYITIHVPLMDSTKGMINKAAIDEMKDGVVLLNYARDLLVDEDAVLEALKAGKMKKYVTDFANPKVVGAEGTIVTPHLGASTKESEDNCAVMAVKEIRDFLENGNIRNSVNFPNCSMGVCTGAGRVTICHKNIPGMLGAFTTVMGNAGVNISDMTNKGKGDYAYTMMDLESEATEEMVKALEAVDGVLKVRIIQ